MKYHDKKGLPRVEVDVQAVECLTEARNLIEKVGWCQHHAVEIKNGQFVGYCVIGSVQYTKINEVSTVNRVLSYFRSVIGSPKTQISDWNDRKGRTKEEVVAAFNKAINKAMGVVK